MENRKIVAILGLPGSGKTEAINYLIKKLNWLKVYFGDVTFDEMKSRGIEINEENEREVREGLRAQFGQLIYAQRVIKKIESLPDDKNVLVESLYSWPEYSEFKKKFGKDFITIAVYASPKIRYERLGKRPVRPLTPEECLSRDYAQIENLFQGGPIAIADYTVINEGSKKDLYEQVDRIINDLDNSSL
jgi:dephospho-CoA kinase